MRSLNEIDWRPIVPCFPDALKPWAVPPLLVWLWLREGGVSRDVEYQRGGCSENLASGPVLTVLLSDGVPICRSPVAAIC